MLRDTGVNGVTAARGSIGNPWIFRQCEELLAGRPLPAAPSVFEQRDVLLEHYRLAEVAYAGRASRQLRKFGIRYADWHPDTDDVRADFIAARNGADWHGVVRRWYSRDQAGVYPANPGLTKPAAAAMQE